MRAVLDYSGYNSHRGKTLELILPFLSLIGRLFQSNAPLKLKLFGAGKRNSKLNISISKGISKGIIRNSSTVNNF